MSKSKRRREARRRARERREEGRTEAPQPGAGAEEAAAAPVQARQPRPARKKPRRGGRSLRVSPWLIATPLAVAGIAVLVFLVMSSGSSGSTDGDGGSAATADPRVAGLTPTTTIEIEASDRGAGAEDSFYSPADVQAKAGDVIEFVVTNTGTVTHNLRLSGPNGEYDVDTTGEKGDDFEMPPNVIKPGDTERLVVKIDEPGVYPFRCDFHPQFQKGTLTLE